mmetsp:Transcript_24788/g.38937  ORF Transcript_24788/g.38937 Transcript_24788/m.38937 type:complete len:286 (-) Transcript_24788:103-960(-)
MVKVGGYTVELVTADTKEPFKEHTAPDGKIYAEVEPGMDYFIHVSSHVRGVMMRFAVDGVDLGYRDFFTGSHTKKYRGSWERRDNRHTITALHFNKTRLAQGVTPDMLTGKVEVKVYAIGEKYYEKVFDYVSAPLTDDSTLGGKKCIKSTTSGSQSFDHTPRGQTASSMIERYKFGEHLRTITLNYCSALGLIYHKILPRPPDSDSDDDSVPVKKESVPVKKESVPVKKERPKRAKRKRSTETSVATAGRASSGEKKTTAQNNGEQVEMVTVQKTYSLVDLTGDD